MKKAAFLTLAWQDYIKGFITAFITVVIATVYSGLQQTPISFPSDWTQWKTILLAGLAAGLGYLIKNFFTSSQDKFMVAEPKTTVPPEQK